VACSLLFWISKHKQEYVGSVGTAPRLHNVAARLT
jgi:hypothetical protein